MSIAGRYVCNLAGYVAVQGTYNYTSDMHKFDFDPNNARISIYIS